MPFQRCRTAETFTRTVGACAGAATVTVGLFLPWYCFGADGGFECESAWSIFAIAHVFMFSIAAALVVVAIVGPSGWLFDGLAALTALGMVAYCLWHIPNDPLGYQTIMEPQAGIWTTAAGFATSAIGQSAAAFAVVIQR